MYNVYKTSSSEFSNLEAIYDSLIPEAIFHSYDQDANAIAESVLTLIHILMHYY